MLRVAALAIAINGMPLFLSIELLLRYMYIELPGITNAAVSLSIVFVIALLLV